MSNINNKLLVIHISSEVYPFSKTGGLADVAYSLAMKQAEGKSLKVLVFTPFYRKLMKSSWDIVDTGLKTWVDSGDGVFEYHLFRKDIKNITFYFLYNDSLFGRDGFYGEDGKDYNDNDLRFGTFCKACLNLIGYLRLSPDIIHCHDWQASFIPLLLKIPPYLREYSGIKSVFTIHNLAFQGIFHRDSLMRLSLPDLLFDPGSQVSDQKLYLKANLGQPRFLQQPK